LKKEKGEVKENAFLSCTPESLKLALQSSKGFQLQLRRHLASSRLKPPKNVFAICFQGIPNPLNRSLCAGILQG
jgi:hypothetical protein